jgi:hypothetical protein
MVSRCGNYVRSIGLDKGVPLAKSHRDLTSATLAFFAKAARAGQEAVVSCLLVDFHPSDHRIDAYIKLCGLRLQRGRAVHLPLKEVGH